MVIKFELGKYYKLQDGHMQRFEDGTLVPHTKIKCVGISTENPCFARFEGQINGNTFNLDTFEEVKGDSKSKKPTPLKADNIFLINKEKDVIYTPLKNLKVGFEVEFDSSKHITDICNDLGIEREKGGLKKITQKLNDDFSITKEIDLFKDDALLVYGYNDGSVNCEIVSNAFDLNTIYENMTQAYKLIKESVGHHQLNYFANGRAGQHLTFINGEHKNKSNFSYDLVHNVTRFYRSFYDSIIMAFANGDSELITRPLDYRTIDQNYCIVRTKQNSDKSVWGIEFRFPDGHANPELNQFTSDFCKSSLIAMNKLCKNGLKMYIKQEQLDRVRNLNHYCNGITYDDDEDDEDYCSDDYTGFTRNDFYNYYQANKKRLDLQNKLILKILKDELDNKKQYEVATKVFDFEERFKPTSKKVLISELLPNYHLYKNDYGVGDYKKELNKIERKYNIKIKDEKI